jgi:competence ComEA-like helix-hairpin-helix protein
MKGFSRITAMALALALAGFTFVAPVLAAKPAPASKVNLNQATVEQLTALPGVGEKLAGRIVEYRQKSGGFKATNELMNVVGIGEKNFVKLQPYITVGGSDSGKAEASAKKVVPARSDAQ